MKIQWLGHSAFRIETSDQTVIVDPFLTGNPKFSGTIEEATKGATIVALTHGHGDHLGDALTIVGDHGIPLVAMVELAWWAESEGVKNAIGMNFGGTVRFGDTHISMVPAVHSSGYLVDGKPIYLGNPGGLVIKDASKSVYHMGDTDIFSDMALINEVHKPNIGIVPTGGHYTMDSKVAALACDRFFDFESVIPCHYGTIPILEQDASGFADAYGKSRTTILEPMGSAEF